MVSVLGATGGGWSAVGGAVGEFALQMSVGAAVGIAGGWLLVRGSLVSLPARALYPLRAVALALLVYGAAAALHGSGFLAVFVAGIVAGDADVPHRREVRGFTSVLGTLGEIVAFTVLGLSVSLHDLVRGHVLWPALALTALLVLAVRPILVGAVLWPIRLSRGERVFVLWSGLKGAVPILLGTYLLTAHEPGAARSYHVIVVVVAVSVLVQGTLVPQVARWCRVPMRRIGE
jgi:cell volume regulation protein A